MVEIRPTDGAAQFAMRLREIERRLAGLETMRRTPYTDIYDEDGNLLGSLSADGLAFFDADGDPSSKLDGDGIVVYDANGQPITSLGASGVAVYDTDGDELVSLDGEGITVYDASGDPITELDGTGITVYDGANKAMTAAADGLTVYDVSENARLTAGNLGASGYGVEILDGDNHWQLKVDGNGMSYPYLTVPVIELGANRIAVTSGSYDTTHSAQIEYTSHTGLYCWVNAVCDSGTTGEFRLRTWFNGASRNTTAAVNVGSSVVQQQFRWLHQIPLATGPVTVYVEARRTGGTGNVYIYQSHGVALAAPDLCVANGVP